MFDVVPRTPDSRLTCFLVVTKGKGYELLNAKPKFERFPAEAIRELVKSPQAMPTTTKDIGIALSFNSDPIVSFLEKRDSQGSKPTSKEVQLIGYGQFRGDRMVGTYQEEEANGLMWLRNKVKEHSITFPIDEQGDDISILVSKGQASFKPKLDGDNVSFDVKIEAWGTVREDLSNQDTNESDVLHNLEQKFAEQIKKNVQACLKQMQNKGTDSAQLGLVVWRNHPDAWKKRLEQNWRTLFKEASFNIQVTATITETGLINQNVIKDGMR
ncbi:Ger(x)C family spore germination protein [Paenibacillus hexagrammi]|uniref:Ger(X)C family spore germination protein n=1 Tax=Paenibacillus hexagrammi TaxID=2908839 RepID=A0ABY3SJM0_9BACL|nr:Ger(x)C family spore germination protein [Paenibacillus sp. YPD9-1]UJF34244.1 Ger(x)C family spore germination protein [Paenibacillus sp. YPD9-1]